MIPRPFDAVLPADILSLVENEERESRTLDFKRDFPGTSDKEKVELRADVSALANTAGGDLLFGIDELDGRASALQGLGGIDIDAAIRHIEQVIQSHIEPRITGVRVRAIDVAEGKSIILVRVPKSWQGPHFVRINDSRRMYARTTGGKHLMDSREIREAFLAAEAIPERARQWRDDRLVRIAGSDTPMLLEAGPKFVLQLVPVSTSVGTDEIVMRQLAEIARTLNPFGSGGWNHRINADGFVTYSGEERVGARSPDYCQIYRSGRIESVTTELTTEQQGNRVVATGWWERSCIGAIRRCFDVLGRLDIQPPLILFTALMEARGAVLASQSWSSCGDGHPIDRDLLILPELLVEEYGQPVDRLLRPVFDAMWNAGGWVGSPNYDEEGNWRPR